jgi:hypothetical protein
MRISNRKPDVRWNLAGGGLKRHDGTILGTHNIHATLKFLARAYHHLYGRNHTR